MVRSLSVFCLAPGGWQTDNVFVYSCLFFVSGLFNLFSKQIIISDILTSDIDIIISSFHSEQFFMKTFEQVVVCLWSLLFCTKV